MNAKMVISFLALFLVSAVLTEEIPVTQSETISGCQCVKNTSRFIRSKFIHHVTVFQSGSHCPNLEVIATLKHGKKVCLEPTANWVERIIKKMSENFEINTESP